MQVRCDGCGKRPEDPMWVEFKGLQSISCLGCVADLRSDGLEVTVLNRVDDSVTDAA